jgi:hypothetical protein
MPNILILITYPNSLNIRDGFFQRVKSIDDHIRNNKRTYVTLRFRKNFVYREEKLDRNLTTIHLNLFVHFWRLLQLFRNADTIMTPSVSCMRLFLWAFVFSGSITKKNIIYDVHGVMPEEHEYAGKYWRGLYLGILESLLFRWARTCVFVTNSMKTYYINKYPFIVKKNLVVYPTLSALNLSATQELIAVDMIPLPLSDRQRTVFVYSGNLQAWQNVPEMLTAIKSLIDEPSYEFIILTMRLKEFEELIKQYGIEGNITLKSVAPEELPEYYRKAHYGFVLRDAHLLNQVACPTKMVDYLAYGIIPVVKSKDIGDFVQLGYEYVCVDKLDHSFAPRKSKKNQEIVHQLVREAQTVDFEGFL